MQVDSHYMDLMLSDPELKRLYWRAHHRGTKEADLLIGGFFDAHFASWGTIERVLFEEMLEEQDVDIMAWAHGTADAPERFDGPMIDALKKLDYIAVAR
jgi:antitoxin CptB